MTASLKLIASLVILLAAGCSAISPAPAPTVAIQRQAGSWEFIHYTMAFEGTGLSGDMAEMVKAGQASVGQKDLGGPLCLLAEEAAKDDLTIRLQEAIHLGPEWKIARAAVAADGTVDFAATMDDPQQGKGTMSITGRLTATTTDLLVTTDASQPAPGKGHIHTVMKQENTRKGDCEPDQATIG